MTAPPLPEGPWEAKLHTRRAPQTLQRRVSQQKKKNRPGTRREGGQRREKRRSQQSACAHRIPGCGTATKRAERGPGNKRSKRLRRPTVFIFVSTFRSTKKRLSQPSHQGKTSRPTQGTGGAKQNGDIGLPLPPFLAASPPHWCEKDPTRDRRLGPTEKQTQMGGNEALGRRATTTSRLYIPFEAMFAHPRTSRQLTALTHYRSPTPQD